MSNTISPDVQTSPPRWLSEIERRTRTLRYGQITVTIHDGRVVQLEVNEKTRFDTPPVARRTGKF